jgi:hypothetical protein
MYNSSVFLAALFGIYISESILLVPFVSNMASGTDCTDGKINGCGVIRSVAYCMSEVK